VNRFFKCLLNVAIWVAGSSVFALAGGCAPDAVKPIGDGKISDPGTTQIAASALEKLPVLTLESILQQFKSCGLPVGFESSQSAFTGQFATPGPLVWGHEASGCVYGGTSVAKVLVSPTASLSGPFKNPVLTFAATQTVDSQCSDKYTNRAASDAAPYQRTLRYDVLPVESRPERIGSIGPWKKAICTLAAVTGITHEYKTPGSGDSSPQSFRTQVEFLPAIPAMVVPAAALRRAFANELGSSLVFEKIVARVKSSNDQRLPAGREITGTVTVESISPQKVIIDPDSKTQMNLRTSIGVRIKSDFGGVQVTQALGLFPWVEYFIDQTTGTIKFISVSNPDPDPKRPEIIYQ
jgi:hypothetical protein